MKVSWLMDDPLTVQNMKKITNKNVTLEQERERERAPLAILSVSDLMLASPASPPLVRSDLSGPSRSGTIGPTRPTFPLAPGGTLLLTLTFAKNSLC